MFKSVKYYLKKAEKIIAKDLSHLSKIVNIYINYRQNVIGQGNFDNRAFSPEQKHQIPQVIADFIKSQLTAGDVQMPAFISQVEVTPNKDLRVDLELAEKYFTKTEFSDQLLKCIGRKEEKANNYRNARKVNALWLLVIIDDINSFSGFNVKSDQLPIIESSNFENIMMFEKFTGNVHVLYAKVP